MAWLLKWLCRVVGSRSEEACANVKPPITSTLPRFSLRFTAITHKRPHPPPLTRDPGSDRKPGQICSVGAPRRSQNCVSMSSSDWPLKSVSWSMSSAMMHPQLHMSEAGPYLDAPSMISGARYHAVHTPGV